MLFEKYKLDLEVYDEERQTYKKRKAKQEPADLRERPEPPATKKLLLDLSTLEGLRTELKTCPRGILYYTDEFAGLIGQMDRYSNNNGDRPLYLQLFNGGSLNVGRAGDVIRVPNWSAILCGGLTPSGLDTFGKLQDDGLLQRMMICNLAKRGMQQYREPNRKAFDTYSRVLQNLHDQNALAERGAIRLDDGAQEAYGEFCAWLSRVIETSNYPPSMLSHIGKWDAIVARLTLVFHLTEAAARSLYPEPFIPTRTMERAITLLKEWQLPHLEMFWLNTMAADHSDSLIKKLAAFILARDVEILTGSELNRYFTPWRCKGMSAMQRDIARKEAIAGMCSFGWIRSVVGGQHEVNPAVRTLFARQAREAKERRQEFADLMPSKMPNRAKERGWS